MSHGMFRIHLFVFLTRAYISIREMSNLYICFIKSCLILSSYFSYNCYIIILTLHPRHTQLHNSPMKASGNFSSNRNSWNCTLEVLLRYLFAIHILVIIHYIISYWINSLASKEVCHLLGMFQYFRSYEENWKI